jgi:hypothetical protein
MRLGVDAPDLPAAIVIQRHVRTARKQQRSDRAQVLAW